MYAKTITRLTVDIQTRFFDAIDECVKRGTLSSFKFFIENNDLLWTKYCKIRRGIRHPDRPAAYKLIDIEALSLLVTEGKVSAQWLLTGKGKMFDKNNE